MPANKEEFNGQVPEWAAVPTSTANSERSNTSGIVDAVKTLMNKFSKNGRHIASNSSYLDYDYLNRGKLQKLNGDKFHNAPGFGNRCHENVANIYNTGKFNGTITTGFGLGAEDNIWRPHTWLTHENGDIHETTMGGHKAYFGVDLTAEEAKEFVRNNKSPRLPNGGKSMLNYYLKNQTNWGPDPESPISPYTGKEYKNPVQRPISSL